MKIGAAVVISFVVVAGTALILYLDTIVTAVKKLNSAEPPSSIVQREVRIRDAVVFQGASHDQTKFVAFVETVAKKKGAAPLTGCQEEMLLGDKLYKSSLRKEFGKGESQSVITILIRAPRTVYRKDAKVRLVCKTTATDWQAVELPELTFR